MRRVSRAGVVVLAATVLGLTSTAAALAGDANGKHARLAHLDVRTAPAAQIVLDRRAADLSANPPAATSALKDSLGAEGAVQLDPLTGTASFVGRTDGFLTGASGASAASIASGYVSANAAALGLDSSAVAALKLTNDYVSIDGTHHLSYSQEINGISVFGNGVKVNVAKGGQVINVVGSPLATTAGAPAASPGITAGQAILVARSNVGEGATMAPSTTTGGQTDFADGDSAKLVYFKTVNGLVLGYRTIVFGSHDAWTTVVDAANSKVLYRQTLSSDANPVNGSVWDYRPGAAHGGTQHTVDLSPWLTSSTRLIGNNTLVYDDINSNNVRDATEDVTPGAYAFQPFTDTTNSACSAAFPCSWNSTFPGGSFSWQTNRNQNAVQVFFFINTYHDHLQAAPIGFTAAAGNFQITNPAGQGVGGDPVLGEPDDGANTLCCSGGVPVGLPDPNHIDNANFATPPDGFAPRMQMYLFNDPLSALNGAPDDFIQANGGDEADVVYHEYTHGLSHRLVTDADGNATLGNIQSGAMGEAWSDWYAEDFLVDQGFVTDAPGHADVLVGEYVSGGGDLIRTEAADCKVGPSTEANCRGGRTGHTGGYTYADYAHVTTGPEVHADGEIWVQTLWDLRDALGSTTTENLVTRAMELSPANPSMLDERNAILQADLVDNGGANHDTIWAVFAHRGMGFFAGALNGDDAQPVADTSLPPTSSRFGKLTGKVTDVDTGKPIGGATIAFGGHASGFADDIVGVTKGNGSYDIKKILVGTYPKVSATAPGYDPVAQPSVVIDSHANNLDWSLQRDYAALSGGASIKSFTGPDFSPDCGPQGAIDQSQGIGWGSVTDGDDGVATGNVTAHNIVIQLPFGVDINAIKINPSNTCGDPGSSSVRGYLVETSTDGTTFTKAATGVFYSGDRNRMNSITLAGSLTGVKFIRFTMLNPQVPNAASASCDNAATCGADPTDNTGVAAHCGPGKDNGFGGCQFTDMSEIAVYGRPS